MAKQKKIENNNKIDFELKSIQHPEELQFIIDNCKGKKNFIEIGTNQGGTFIELCKVVKGLHISIDLEYPNPDQKIDFDKRNEAILNQYPDSILITGDSHLKETKDKLIKALNGQKVDVLFIDGDHSYKGIKQDYKDYKEFVNEGGLIIFHDIIDSEFHRKHECYVSKFWNELKGDKTHKIVSDTWGGVGILKYKPINWKLFQIYYDNETKKHILPEFIPYENLTKNTQYFENDVIISLYNNINNIDADYFGTLSWKFKQKTQFETDEFIGKIENELQSNDVVLFPPFRHRDENCIERNKTACTNLYKLSELIDKANVLPFKICSSKWTTSYCNFWIAKKEIYKDYCEKVLLPVYNLFEHNKEIKEFCRVNKFRHGKDLNHIEQYPIMPFLMELLMGFYVNAYDVKHTSIFPESTDFLNNPVAIMNRKTWVVTFIHPSYLDKIGTKKEMPAGMAHNLFMKGYITIKSEDNNL